MSLPEDEVASSEDTWDIFSLTDSLYDYAVEYDGTNIISSMTVKIDFQQSLQSQQEATLANEVNRHNENLVDSS